MVFFSVFVLAIFVVSTNSKTGTTTTPESVPIVCDPDLFPPELEEQMTCDNCTFFNLDAIPLNIIHKVFHNNVLI